jgi:hypothetical protein
MRQRLNQKVRHLLPCAFCRKAASWLVTGDHSLAACDVHVGRIERHGIHALTPSPDRRRQPL